MKIPRLFFKKVLVAMLCIAIACVASLALKDFVDSINPELSLPVLEVRCAFTTPIINGDGSAERSLFRANYSWMFITGVKEGKGLELEGLALYPTTLPPNVPLLFQFTHPLENIKISRADGLYGTDFVEIVGDITSPFEPGVYCYKIEADFERGSILYYLSVRVEDLAG